MRQQFWERSSFFTQKGNSMLAQQVNKIKYISQTSYDKFINQIDFSTCKCACGAIGRFVRHGYYLRSIKNPNKKVKLSILRVKCKSCSKTHAILHPTIIPYSQIVLFDTIKIIICKLNNKNYYNSPQANLEINEEDIVNTEKRFFKYWYERLIALISSTFENIIEYLNKSNSIINIFRVYNKAFMQIHRGYYYLC